MCGGQGGQVFSAAIFAQFHITCHYYDIKPPYLSIPNQVYCCSNMSQLEGEICTTTVVQFFKHTTASLEEKNEAFLKPEEKKILLSPLSL